MNFEKAFRETLVKWQQIAAGKQRDPASDCGLCEWAKQYAYQNEQCMCCPAWFHYKQHGCAHSVLAVEEAVWHYYVQEWPELRLVAQEVVVELLAVKESLFAWAAKLDGKGGITWRD